MKRTGILIADDHPMIRKTITEAFRKNSDIVFLGEANNGVELMQLIKKAAPDIAIIDLAMPEMDGYETILELHTQYPQIRTIALSGFLNPANQQRVIEMGATATISKTETLSAVKKAIQAVIDGKTFHSKSSFDVPYNTPNDEKYFSLTLREKQILKLISQGKTSQQISAIFNISKWTVDKHRSNIKEKLGIKNLAELIRYAIGRMDI